MSRNIRAIVAENVKTLRKTKGWRQIDLAKRSGIAQSHISNIEHREGKSPTLNILEQLAAAFDVEPWTLLVESSSTDLSQKLQHLMITYLHLPNEGKTAVERIAEAEERYSKLT